MTADGNVAWIWILPPFARVTHTKSTTHEVAEFLVKVKTAEEVLEFSGAFLQIYREEARYLDRTVHWLQRVGLDYVKAKVVEDPENRKALYGRLLYALQTEQDPWAQRVASSAARREFEVLAV